MKRLRTELSKLAYVSNIRTFSEEERNSGKPVLEFNINARGLTAGQIENAPKSAGLNANRLNPSPGDSDVIISDDDGGVSLEVSTGIFSRPKVKIYPRPKDLSVLGILDHISKTEWELSDPMRNRILAFLNRTRMKKIIGVVKGKK